LQENTAIIPTSNLQIDDIDFGNISQIANLTQKQKIVLFYMLESFQNPDELDTDTAIAEKSSCTRETVSNCRKNPSFISAYTYLVKEISKTRTGTVLNRLYDMTKDSPKAVETFLKYTDQLIDKQQRLNANINYTQGTGNHLESLVESLKHAGYTLERLLTEITDIWNS